MRNASFELSAAGISGHRRITRNWGTTGDIDEKAITKLIMVRRNPRRRNSISVENARIASQTFLFTPSIVLVD